MKKLNFQIGKSKPVEVGGLTIQPLSQSISWMARTWGIVWNRPYAVQVDDGETTTQIPIVDHTRLALIFLWGLTIFFSLITVRYQLKNRR